MTVSRTKAWKWHIFQQNSKDELNKVSAKSARRWIMDKCLAAQQFYVWNFKKGFLMFIIHEI